MHVLMVGAMMVGVMVFLGFLLAPLFSRCIVPIETEEKE
jgi:hypothetical protein